jgi:small-conductance mechanosensitive channel
MISQFYPKIEQFLPNQYFRAFIILVILLIVIRTIIFFIEKTLLKLSSRTKTDIDDIILKKSSKPLIWLTFIISLVIAISEISLETFLGDIINHVLYSLMVVIISIIIFIIVDNLIIRAVRKFASKTKSNVDDTLISLLNGILKFSLIAITLIYILNIWGIQIGPLLAGLGIAGLAVALALQPTLSNIFSGIAIILDQTFHLGDVVKLQSGEMGEIHKIGLRTTRIKSFDNEMIIIPNSKIADSIVQNFYQPDRSIRVNIDFGVEYGNDPEYVKKMVIEEIETIEFIDKKQEIRVLFTTMGASSLDFKVMFWVDDISKKWPAHQEGISRIYRRLYKEGIGIPFPQTTVWLRDEGKAKSPNPQDKKFDKVKDKYYSAFGHEYKDETKGKSEKKDNGD